jgi:hypothetical protein
MLPVMTSESDVRVKGLWIFGASTAFAWPLEPLAVSKADLRKAAAGLPQSKVLRTAVWSAA